VAGELSASASPAGANARTPPLDIAYLGIWETPFWVGDENKGTMRRVGFEARTRLNRQDFGVSW
jgi:hypothetical protein